MIGTEADFSLYNTVNDTPNPPDVISQFGTMYGDEDGWCEEMQQMGFFGTRRIAPKVMPIKKQIAKARQISHPMAEDCYPAQMGFSLSDITKDIQAQLDKAKAQVSAQFEAAKQAEIDKLKATAAKQVGTLITQAQTQATKTIQSAVPKLGTAAQTAVVKASQSPITSSLVKSGVDAGLEETKSYIGALALKYGPMALVGGLAAAGLAAYLIMRRK